MKHMNTFLLAVLGFTLALLPASMQAKWQDYCQELHWACGSAAPDEELVKVIANQVVFIIESVLGVVAVLAVIWGSVMISTSGFNEENRNKGKNMIIVAIVGTMLAILAVEILHFFFIAINDAL